MRLALVLLMTLTAPLTQPASAEVPCVDHSLYGVPRTEHPVSGTANELQLVDDYLYSASSNGLRILRETSPGDFQEVGAVSVPGTPNGLRVTESIAYVAAATGGLHIVDVSDPTTPIVLGSDATAYAQDVAVQASHTFVAAVSAGTGFVRVLDVSDPMNPSELTMWSPGLPGYFRRVTVQGNLLFLAGESGLAVADVTVPASPQLLALVSTDDVASDVVLRNHLAYVAAGEAGLRVIDVSTPSAPLEIGGLALPELATRVTLLGEVAIVTSRAGQAMLVDISISSAPSYLGYSPVGQALDLVPLDKHRVAIGITFGTLDGALATIDLGDLQLTPSFGRLVENGSFGNSEVVGDRLFSISDGTGFDIWDLGKGAPATFLGSYAGYAYADIAVSTLGTDGETVLLSGVLDTGLGGPLFTLDRIDVSNPAAPNWTVQRSSSQTSFQHPKFADGVAWTRSGSNSLTSWNTVDPNLSQISVVPSTGFLNDHFAIRGGFAFASGMGLEVFDVSAPTTATSVALLPIPGATSGITLHGEWAFLGGTTFTVVNIDDPTAPFIAASLDLSEFDDTRLGAGIHVHDTFAYVPTEYTVQVVDISDPFAPIRVAEFHSLEPERIQGVYGVDGALALMPSGFLVPPQCGAQATSTIGTPIGAWLSLVPNPFRESLSIQFSTRSHGHVSVDVFDVRGRLVRELSSGERPRGSYTIQWDGENRSGQPAAPGVYLFRVATPSGDSVQRAVHIR